MKRIFLLSNFILALFHISLVLASPTYSNIYIFGDSASDTGNLASIFPTPLHPPFYMASRISNGPVAVEIMANRLGYKVDASLYLVGPEQGTNYAVAGARSSISDTISLDTQVGVFLLNHSQVAPGNALYIVFIGANDIRDARDSINKIEQDTIIDRAIANIRNNVTLLKTAGAKNFLIVNVPDIGLAPETHIIAQATGNPALVQLASSLSIKFNKKLRRVAYDLKQDKSLHINRFNYYKFTRKLAKNYIKLGFTVNDLPCYDSTNFQFLPGCEEGANFDQYVFFDALHFTARVHKILGKALAKDIVKFSKRNKKEHDSNAVASAH